MNKYAEEHADSDGKSGHRRQAYPGSEITSLDRGASQGGSLHAGKLSWTKVLLTLRLSSLSQNKQGEYARLSTASKRYCASFKHHTFSQQNI